MARTLVPKYKYVAIARDITRLLSLSPALEWWQVRDYYEMQLIQPVLAMPSKYDDHQRQQIATAIDREMRYIHVR